MRVEIPACPPEGGSAVFFDAKGNIERVFVYKDDTLVEIKYPISKDDFLKKYEDIKLEDWGSEILPVEIKCSPGHWAIINGQYIWVP
ncbi:MAG: hypothetical protein HF982_03355 [Desulfobacteraceae bacterium]|nr:hypothetical protein [Desulfobacteraceae bacterium]MBC2718622.1 hypothetical protein [Desulfobacteraceae bacterium]